MKGLVLNPLTQSQVEAFLAVPSHALMLTGPPGSGKGALAVAMAEAVLQLPDDGFAGHPYGLLIAPEEGKAISIEVVRRLDQFLALKVPGKTAFDRAIIIEDAHLMTTEAQNALLKMLEEPPQGTILILTVSFQQSVLPTIRSRVQAIPLSRLERGSLEAHFSSQGFEAPAIKKAYAVSGGLPGRMYGLLHDADHPLMLATGRARQLLSQSAYERLAAVDELSKQRALAIDIATILQQMAHISLQTASGPAAHKWQGVLKASYQADVALSNSAQPKLALTRLMLSL